jgi:predicted transposase YdaD
MDHDHSYKLLFSHRDMMADLLRGFVTAEWVHTVDLTTLERVQSSQVSDNLRDREDDIIWHARCFSPGCVGSSCPLCPKALARPGKMLA